MHEIGSFSIPAFRQFVPEKLRPWIIIVFVIIFQLSGGVYLASLSEMVGSLTLRQEDIIMASTASLIGMSLTFNIMFRLKFRFSSKASLLTCCIVIILCNLICMHTASVPVLVSACFVGGIFRMWGTFECNSTIQLWLTPTRDLSIFFCFIYLLVNSCIEISSLTTAYTAFFTTWEYMHWLVIGLLGSMILTVVIMFRSYRSMKRMPLYGIDWLGAILWGSTLLCVCFVCIYGEYYDWYDSVCIQMATTAAVVILILNLWRASFIKHPYIALETLRFRMVYLTFLLFIVVDLLIAPSHLFEHILMKEVLGYDSLNVVSLNWAVVAGNALGCLFMYQTFALRKWRYKTMTLIAFTSILSYLMIFYFTIDYNLPKEIFVLPLFLRGFGYAMIAICFLTALCRVPFKNFFGAVSFQAFMSAAVGGVLGTAILGRALKVVMAKNSMLLNANLDHVNTIAGNMSATQLYGIVQQHSLMISMKELYGWLAVICMFCILLFLFKESSLRPKLVIQPKLRSIRRFIKHELREKIS